MKPMWNYVEVFENRYNSICLYAYSMLKDREEAESIVKDAFVKLWFMRDNFEDERQVLKFLYLIVKNASINLVRHQKVAKRHLEAVIYEARETTEDPLNPITRQSLIRRLVPLLCEMPTRMQDAIYLKYYTDLKIWEISRMMGLRESTVKEHLAKGKEWLRKRLMIGEGDREALR